MSGSRLVAVVAVVALGAAALVAIVAAPAGAESFPGTNGLIAFRSDRGLNAQIYVMNPDGSSPANLTASAFGESMPSWSADGSKIAYTTNRAGNGEIGVMDANGANQTDVTNNAAFDSAPSWSPDGTHIAFTSFRNSNDDIYVMKADGSEQTRLTTSSGDDDHPSWSPDGTKIAFQSDRNNDWEIFVMDASGANQTDVTNLPSSLFDTEPSWSPDGTKIAFTSRGDIYSMNADGSSQTNVSNTGDGNFAAAWSPDGTKIAFVSTRDQALGEIYVMAANGSAQTRITSNTVRDWEPSWQPGAPPVGQYFHGVTPARIIDSRPPPSRVGPLGAWTTGATQNVTVTGGLSGVPGTATAVVLNVTATGGTANGDYLSIWPAGAAQPTVSSLNVGAGQTIANQVTVKLGVGGANAGKISIFNAGGTQNVIVDVNGYYDPTPGDGFTSLAPARIIDSRPPPSRVGPLGPWTAGATQNVTAVGGLSGVPSDADAVVLNVTATGGTANGNYLTIWPAGTTQPSVSSLNVNAGQSIPNAVTVPLGIGGVNAGRISIFSAGGTQNVIVDVAGYFKAGTGKAFYPQAPSRIIDSRPPPSRVGPVGPWTTGATQNVTAVGGLSGVPSGADSIVANVTATGGTVNGDYLSIWPAGSAQPTVSSLNFNAGDTIANAVTVKLGVGGGNAGRISVFNAGGTVNVIVDIAGYYA